MNIEDIKLLPHNQVTYNKIQEAWKTSNKVASIQATGTGKSYLILKCLYNIPNENKLVLAPSNYILEQLENEFGEQLPNTTLITYSKLAFMNNEEIQDLNLSLIVMDEFHRCGAEQWGTGIQKLLDAFPNAKILGTSATNIRFLDDNRDMAEELFDGNVVNNLSLAEAIVKKILPMPKYVSALYTFEDETEVLKNKVNNSKNTDKEKEELLKEIDKMKNKLDKSKGIPQILKKHLSKNSSDKFIVFCKDNQHLNEMKEIVVNWFKKAKITKEIDVYTAYSDYNNTDKEVDEFIKNNSDDTIKLLFTIDMFNEGVHIKDISGVILLRPTTSPIIYYQQIGRAIAVGKKAHSLIFDFVNNFDNIGAKKFVDDLKEYTKQQKGKSENNKNNKDDKIDDFEFIIFDEIQEAKNLFENIEDKLYNNWDKMYEELKKYYEKNGYIEIRKNDELSKWVYDQRSSYKKGLLKKEKVKKLQDINFSWEFIEDNWNYWYNKLKEFYNKNGNCLVTPKKDKQLCMWVRNQRSAPKGRLTPDKIEKLNEIDFKWNVNNSQWDFYYNKLKDYYTVNGSSDIKFLGKSKDNQKFLKWIFTQRETFKKGKLSFEKIKKLEQINFVWDKKEEKWNKMFNYLIEYKNVNGNLNIPYNFKIAKNMNLDSWVKSQKKIYKENRLSEDKIKKLNEIGFVWN